MRRTRNVHLNDGGVGFFECCSVPFRRVGLKVIENRVSGGKNKFRRKPSGVAQKRILDGQDHRCLYCCRRIGSVVYKRGEYKGRAFGVRLKLVWDHYVPYIYSLDSSDSNFVAACHICNGFKSDLMMDSLKDYRNHIADKWERRYWDSEDDVSWS
jgi:hypothetical protein